MMGRFARRTLTLALSLTASLGCTSWPNSMPTTMLPPQQQPVVSNRPGGELSNVQAAQLCFTAGEALEKKGFTAEAIRQYENARQHAPGLPNVSHRLAVLYDLQGDAVRAETEYGRALQEQPRNVELLNNVGYFHYAHGRMQTAENWLRNAVTVNPDYAPAWVNLGQVLAHQGRVEDSYQAFAHALRPAEAYSNLGVLLAKHGRTREARNALQQAIALDPSLEQPRAFLKALASAPSSPAPPPVKLIRSAPKAQKPLLTTAPAPRASTVTMTPAVHVRPSGVASSRTNPAPAPSAPAPMTAALPIILKSPTGPVLSTQAQLPTPISPVPSPVKSSAAPADGPIIIHGPIQPKPVLTRPAHVEARPTPAMPPLPPPPPPPLSLRPAATAGDSGLLRTSASFVSTDTGLSPAKATAVHLLPVPKKPVPTPAAAPQAVLTDCITPDRRKPVSAPAAPPPQVIVTDCQGEAPTGQDQP